PQPPADLLHHVALAVVAVERAPGREVARLVPHAPEAEDALLVRQQAHEEVALVHAADVAAAGRGEHAGDAARLLDLPLDSPQRLVHRAQARALGRVDADLELGLV